MQKLKTIKFFISSTFKDFEQERDILHKFIFPKLKKLCHDKQFGFQPIDLRWGVMEEAGIDQQTMNICLNEVKRSSYKPKPNLLLLVGQRYGWVPIPYSIEQKEFCELMTEVRKNSKEDEKLIREWYKKDENAIYTTYYLKNKTDYKDNREGWSKIENQIRDAFQKATTIAKYHTSATEQEMDEGLDVLDNKHTFAYFRKIKQKYEDIDTELKKDFIDPDLSKLEGLTKKLIENSNIPKDNQIELKTDWEDIEVATQTKYEALELEDSPQYLKDFHDEILEKFTTAIKKEIKEFENNKPTDLEIELEEQNNFLEKKSKLVLGRDKEVKRIIDFIDIDTSTQYYLQYGKSGSGKTSVMAKAIGDIKKISNDYEIIYRFIGTSALSTYSRVLFESIYWEIQTILDNDKKIKKQSLSLEQEEHKFKEQFIKQLNKLDEQGKKIVIFLDALDQFEDYNDLSILLEGLSKNIKVIFSTLYDKDKEEIEDYSIYYNRLNYLENKYPLEALKNEDNMLIIHHWLSDKNRTLTKPQEFYILELLDNEDKKTPLYLKLIFEIVKHWSSDKTDLKLADNENDLIIQFFSFIQKQYHHDGLLIERILGFISASKDGLSESELIDLISRDEDLLDKFQNERYQKLDRLPSAIWSRLYYYIEEFFTEKLIDGEMLITPFHRIISETIKMQYYESSKDSLHKKLANYFLTLQDTEKLWDERYNNLHMLSETPYQLFKSKDAKRLKNILFDLEFAGSIYDNNKQESFIEIMGKAIQVDDTIEDEIYPWESFYREKEHLIIKVNEELWKPHQSLFQLAYEDGLDSPSHNKAKELLQERKVNFNWLKRTYMPDSFYRKGLLRVFNAEKGLLRGVEIFKNNYILSYFENGLITIKNFNNKYFNSFNTEHSGDLTRVEVLDDNKFLSYSTDGTIKLWNDNGELLNELNKHNNAIQGVKILNDGQMLSYSLDNTLILWNRNGYYIKTLDESSDTSFLGLPGIKLINSTHIIFYTSYGSVKLLNYNGKIVKQLNNIKARSIEVYSDNILFIAGVNGKVSKWDIESGSHKVSDRKCSYFNGIELLDDDKFITYDADGNLIVWDSMLNSYSLTGHTEYISGIKLLSDGRVLSYSGDKTIRIWDLKKRTSKVLCGHSGHINGIELLDNDKIISYSDDKTIRIWNLQGQNLAVLDGHDNKIVGIKIINNIKLLSYSQDGEIRLWNLKLKSFYLPDTHEGYIRGINILNNGKITTYSQDTTLRFWTSEGKSLSVLNEHKDQINGVKIVNNKIISFSKDSSFIIWTDDGKLFKKVSGHYASVKGIDIYDNKILSYSSDRVVRTWTLEGLPLAGYERQNYYGNVHKSKFLNTGDVLTSYIEGTMILQRISTGTTSSVTMLGHNNLSDFKSVDNMIISYSCDNKLIIWNSIGEFICELNKHTDYVNGFEILNNKNILSYSDDKTLILWSNSGIYIKTLKEHSSYVRGVKLLNDGKILSYSSDGEIVLWDENCNKLKVMQGHKNSIIEIKVLNNEKIMTFSKDLTIRIWDINGNILELWYFSLEDIQDFKFYKSYYDRLAVASSRSLLVYDFINK
jgi:hypothetical protein